ncbi:sulfite exporter TauE/SafE family protein [Actinospica sp. MGRD01-02]|uniref:Probable membrane transporter protein n=1 Tax=Actinospica acidithermotolerans TaxID=2828514 RepID=A0A941END8_9ACTN|nr:sulfite exporter TauE/SafE family protein [Actinospica acidithermotolerans]MBR7830749.1 sulfite exporter TauE/SafE family protein [Actinospica acidithermotolerans]
MITAAVLAVGLAIGLSLGALGGGGSILTVPALVYLLGESAHVATTESLVIVGVSALAATIAHARAGHVRWGPGLAFGLAGLAASYAGTAANTRVDPQVLMLAFAALMLTAAIAMLKRGAAPPKSATDDRVRIAPAPSPSAPSGGGTAVLTLAPSPPVADQPGARFSVSGIVKLLIAGSAVGFITGFLGVGGGFVIVPVLVTALGYTMADAVGTSLLVIAINSAAALLARTGHMQLHWALLAPFIAAALAGSFAGRNVAYRLPAETLKRAFAVLLVLVAGYVAIRAGLTLAG